MRSVDVSVERLTRQAADAGQCVLVKTDDVLALLTAMRLLDVRMLEVQENAERWRQEMWHVRKVLDVYETTHSLCAQMVEKFSNAQSLLAEYGEGCGELDD